ncbi:hypothetical protein RIF29_19218 [Crotalaria pallida]|uniref:Uncharacterized protein n=1 Tax=Crotalaria pallida TaxID=3830 RepID=A0AAN9F0W3_CROPI
MENVIELPPTDDGPCVVLLPTYLKLLIQLSSGDYSEEDHHSSNNSCSYNVVQGKQHSYKVDSTDSDEVASSIIAAATTTTTNAKDKFFARMKKKKIRYCCMEDLYRITELVP